MDATLPNLTRVTQYGLNGTLTRVCPDGDSSSEATTLTARSAATNQRILALYEVAAPVATPACPRRPGQGPLANRVCRAGSAFWGRSAPVARLSALSGDWNRRRRPGLGRPAAALVGPAIGRRSARLDCCLRRRRVDRRHVVNPARATGPTAVLLAGHGRTAGAAKAREVPIEPLAHLRSALLAACPANGTQQPANG